MTFFLQRMIAIKHSTKYYSKSYDYSGNSNIRDCFTHFLTHFYEIYYDLFPSSGRRFYPSTISGLYFLAVLIILTQLCSYVSARSMQMICTGTYISAWILPKVAVHCVIQNRYFSLKQPHDEALTRHRSL